MTRIASFTNSEYLLTQLNRLNTNMFETQSQISSEKKARTYQQVGSQTGTLLSAQSLSQKTEQFQEQTQLLKGRLELQDVHLTTISDAARSLHQQVLDAIAVDKGDGLMSTLKSLYEQVTAILNTKYNGEYIYSGTLTDTPPLSGIQLSDLASAVNASDLFQNNQLVNQVRIDTNVTVDSGFLASDVALEFFNAVKSIVDFDAGPNGPFGGPLTQAQQTFLSSQVSVLDTAADNLISVVADNGRRISASDQALERHATTETFVSGLIADIENVDVAEAISRLNQDQVTTQATLSLIGQLSRISLLNFL